jgi:hypothetical protein
MAIFVGKQRVTGEKLAEFIYAQNKLLKRMVKAWHESQTKHCFKNEKVFKRAVRRNLNTLNSPATIGTLFTASNYLFSTKVSGRTEDGKAKDRKETLYFQNRTTKQTGRLRQEHLKGSGPLAKIDKRAKTHRFLSEERLRDLKGWDYKHKGFDFDRSEKRIEVDAYHIEFACHGEEVSGWHSSEGTVEVDKHDLGRRSVRLEKHTWNPQ